MTTPWAILGIEPTPDERAIKRAYAQKLKHTRPEDDKEGFLQLREAYERALDQRHWVTEEADPGEALEVETTPPPAAGPAPAHAPAPLRVQRQINPPPLPSEPAMPAQPRKDYRRGWRTASRICENSLIMRIEKDLADPELVHLEARAAYERDLLVWLLKHTVVWPRAFQMAQETLQWREKQSWQEWPWSQLETYDRRCRVRAFFADPEMHRSDFPFLVEWLDKNPAPDLPPKRRPLASILVQRAVLKRDLAQFRSDNKEVLHFEPEGLARLDALEQVLNSFPLEKFINMLFWLIFGLLALYEALKDDSTFMLVVCLVFFGVSLFLLFGLARNFLFPPLLRLLRHLFGRLPHK